jgi:nucleoside-triphosphatase THEP1
MHDQLYILSGPKHSGKTSCLLHWWEKNNEVGGILTPLINGERVFLELASGTIFSMLANEDSREVLHIGKYEFDQYGFDRAIQVIQDAVNSDKKWIVIDEIGPLELEQKGFYSITSQLLSSLPPHKKLLLIIREKILQDAIDFFKMKDPRLVNINAEMFG